MGDLTVAKVSDFGVNDRTYYTRTHLTNYLAPGDLVWGYDLTTTNFNDAEFDLLNADRLPDVVLVRGLSRNLLLAFFWFLLQIHLCCRPKASCLTLGVCLCVLRVICR